MIFVQRQIIDKTAHSHQSLLPLLVMVVNASAAAGASSSFMIILSCNDSSTTIMCNTPLLEDDDDVYSENDIARCFVVSFKSKCIALALFLSSMP